MLVHMERSARPDLEVQTARRSAIASLRLNSIWWNALWWVSSLERNDVKFLSCFLALQPSGPAI